MQLSDIENEVLERYAKYLHNQNPSVDFLVQIIELSGSHLNLETISDYCRRTGMSYNGAKNHRQIIELFGVKYIIDNE